MVELVLMAILLGTVVVIVASPLRRAGNRSRSGEPSARAAIETARDVKYGEILDAELDFLTGKLSERDYREVDGRLRAEAGELLDRLDTAREGGGRR
jgi:hypothetical protein